MPLRRPLLATAVLAGAMVPALAGMTGAHAGQRDTGDITCTGGSFSLTVNPAIRSVALGGERVAQFIGTMDLGLCESVVYPKIRNGKITLRATATAGCDITFITGFIKNGTGQGNINWNTGQRSTFKNSSWRGTLSEISLQHANITEGFLKGGKMELTAVTTANVVSNATGCSAFGIDRLEGYLRRISISGPGDGSDLTPPCAIPGDLPSARCAHSKG